MEAFSFKWFEQYCKKRDESFHTANKVVKFSNIVLANSLVLARALIKSGEELEFRGRIIIGLKMSEYK